MKVNINFELTPECAKQCKEINKLIFENVGSEIDFSTNLCRPHITLLMGEIEDKHLEMVESIVKDTKFECIGKKISFSNPVYNQSYIMINVTGGAIESFKKDCNCLLTKLSNMITPNSHLISDGTAIPHITLGYCKDEIKVKKILNFLPKIDNTMLFSISVDRAGRHGTVLI